MQVLEHVYFSSRLNASFVARGHRASREHCVRVLYKGDEIGMQRLDLVVDERLVLEIKSTQELHKSAVRQIYNYLHATSLELGLLAALRTATEILPHPLQQSPQAAKDQLAGGVESH